MEKKLAIVIPAFKSIYLRDCLATIANQGCKAFSLYIGDDASPHDLKSIIDEFDEELEIYYKRFDENLGSKDLIAHWNRCINMSSEPWVWLFSDDDLMEPNCVELFYNMLNSSADDGDLYHFNTVMINKNGEKFLASKPFPSEVSSAEYFKMIMKGGYFTFAVEYIFKRETYLRQGGFVSFDLAWGSDSATWMKIGREKNIRSLQGATIQWRFSGDNISSIRKNVIISERKILADLYFIRWALKFFREHRIKEVSTPREKIYWTIRQLSEKEHLGKEKLKKLIQLYLREMDLQTYYPLAVSMYNLYNIKLRVKAGLVKLIRKKI